MTQLLTNKDKFGKIDRMGRNYFALEFAEFLESDNFGGINDRKNFNMMWRFPVSRQKKR